MTKLLLFVMGLVRISYANEISCPGLWAPQVKLGSVVLTAGPDEILLQGRLENVGMPDGNWALVTNTEKIFSDPMDHRWILKTGDEVVAKNGKIHGYFREKVNEPHLYKSTKFRWISLDEQGFRDLAQSGLRVTVRHTLDPSDRMKIAERLIPQYEKYLAFLENPERYLSISHDQTYELAHFEVATEGEPEIQVVTDKKDAVISLSCLKHDEVMALEFGDRVFLIDDKDQLLLEIVLDSILVPFAQIRTTHTQALRLKHAARMIVVRKIRA